jgi:hypothetical protein
MGDPDGFLAGVFGESVRAAAVFRDGGADSGIACADLAAHFVPPDHGERSIYKGCLRCDRTLFHQLDFQAIDLSFRGVLERFQTLRARFGFVKGGIFLRKIPLDKGAF